MPYVLDSKAKKNQTIIQGEVFVLITLLEQLLKTIHLLKWGKGTRPNEEWAEDNLRDWILQL